MIFFKPSKIDFFVPYASDSAEAESVYSSIKEFASQTTGFRIRKDVRIYRVEYESDGINYSAQVGETEDRVGEMVFAIFSAPGCILICTTDRGVRRGGPIMVNSKAVKEAILFRDPKND